MGLFESKKEVVAGAYYHCIVVDRVVGFGCQ
jgi:hypothetical protein